MSEVQGDDWTGDYHHGNPPWSKQIRAVPLRTFSGQVVYKRKKHTWHMKDYERIGRFVEIDVDDSDIDWLRILVEYYKNATLTVLEKLLPFMDGESVEKMYSIVMDILGKVFNTSYSEYMATPPADIYRIINAIAEKFRLDITIKPL